MKYLIVLSHLMSKDCILGNESIARAQLAIDVFGLRKLNGIITIGWDYRSDSTVPIADVFKDYIVNNSHIPASLVTSLPYSRDTVGDAYYCLKFLQEKNIEELVVITSDYHTGRVEKIFNTLFNGIIKIEVIGADTPSKNDPSIISHEIESIDAFNSTFSCTDFTKISSIYETISRRHPFYNGQIHPKII